MTYAYADRVLETSTSSGTGSMTLLGAVTGFQSFSQAFSLSTTVPYVISDGTNWEVGLGTLSSSTILTRTTVTASSNAGSLVNFGSNLKYISCDITAGWLSDADEVVHPTSIGISLSSSDYTLTSVQARTQFIILTGTITANINVVVPNAGFIQNFDNQTRGAFTVTVKTAAGTGVVVPQGTRKLLFCDGTNVKESTTSFSGAFSNIGSFGTNGVYSTQLSTPGTATGTGYTTGGTLAAATYYVKIVAVDANGFATNAGAESTGVTTTGSTSSILYIWTAVPGAASYQIWYGTTSGSETAYYTSTTNNYTLTATAGISGTIPTVNATGSLSLPMGSVAAPSLNFEGSPKTGFYQPSANQIGVTVSGVQVGLWTSAGLTLPGNLTVNGTFTTVSTSQLQVTDSFVMVGSGNTTNTVDLGIFAQYEPVSTALYAGLYFDHSALDWKLFSGLQVEPTTTVNTGGAGFTYAKLHVGAFQADGAISLSPASASVTISPTGTGTVTLAPATAGTVNNVVIGGATPLAITGTVVTGNAFIPNSSTVPTNGIYLPAANTLGWATNSTLHMQLDASGDLGLGVTPSAWGYGYEHALQGSGWAISSPGADSGEILVNLYVDSSGTERYIGAYAAGYYGIFAGVHTWATAPVGTAGGAATITQLMRLTNPGHLLLGSMTDDLSNIAQFAGPIGIAGTPASVAGKLSIGSATQTTVGANGAASALTANPLGYLYGYLGTTKIAIPYYNG